MLRKKRPEEKFEGEIIKYLSANGYEYIKPEKMKSTFNKKYAIDEKRLFSFIEATQPDAYAKNNLSTASGRKKFLVELDKSIKKRGIISVLKNGAKRCQIFYHTFDEKSSTLKENFAKNIFAVTNQLTYSDTKGRLELDLCIFINGLPVATIELKSRSASSGWTYKDAEKQYQKDRSNQDTLFAFKRCIAHFAVDENYVTFTTKIDGEKTFFMPFNKGEDYGAGNPVSEGIMTDYLWKEILEKNNFSSLIKDFCYVTGGKDKEKLIFPRYHQWRVVNKLVGDVQKNGVGSKYLIQHSAGSGKSNSITWLAYKLVEARKEGKALFDSVVVVTDRKNLDKQISDNIKKFVDVKSTTARANSANDLNKLLSDGKKIIMTTVQKFPYIIEGIGDKLSNKNFAIIIDEAHSSQSGKAAASLNMAISGKMVVDDGSEIEDLLVNYMQSQKMPENASYFAFTATPKARTMEMFGGAFDVYSMKQAIEEGFILNVLENYTTYKNYYNVRKTTEENPIYDVKKSKNQIRKYVEGSKQPLQQKAEEMVSHFLKITSKKIGGKAKAMVVADSIERAIDYYYIISKLLKDNGTVYKAIVAFSGEKEYKGEALTETTINGFPDNQTPTRFKEDEYKFLIVADKYQTGYDEPLLHTMYVDKKLSDVKAVQTLSRLNRSCSGKRDTCVLDFYNEAEDIQKAFQPYYLETGLTNETDTNKIHEILSVLDEKNVYTPDEVREIVAWFFINGGLEASEPIINRCVKRYNKLEEKDQVEFRSGVKSFIKTYNFLAMILPELQSEWAEKSIFFEILIRRLPTPKGEDLSLGILNNIDLKSYRLEKQKEMPIVLEDKVGELEVHGMGVGSQHETKIDTLSNIVSSFNDKYGVKEETVKNIEDGLYQDEILTNSFRNSSETNKEIEFNRAMEDVISNNIDDENLFLMYFQNEQFQQEFNYVMFNYFKERFVNNNT